MPETIKKHQSGKGLYNSYREAIFAQWFKSKGRGYGNFMLIFVPKMTVTKSSVQKFCNM